MGRTAEGPKVRWRNGWAHVRFTWQGIEYASTLGTRDPVEASEAAARAYADVVSGRLRPIAARPGELRDLTDLWDDFVEWKKPSIDPETTKTLMIYGSRFIDSFKSLDRITEANGATYGIRRLGQVTRSTVLKELCFLRQFVRWCKQQGALLHVPNIPQLPPKATGKRIGPQRAKPVDITPKEARAIIGRLRETSKTIGGRTWPIRDRFGFTWESMFRPETISRLSVPENWRRGMAHVTLTDEDDKARYGREVDLSPRALEILRRVAPSHGRIFGDHNFSKELKRAARAVLGPHRAKEFAPYDFRHGHAKALLDAGAPLRGVAYLLGHKRLTTTDKYLRPDRKAGQAALAAERIAGQYSDKQVARRVRRARSA